MANSKFIKIENGFLCFGGTEIKIKLQDFPCLYHRFAEYVGNGVNTLELENTGEKILKQETTKSADIYRFVQCVCIWGGGWRVFGNLPGRNGGKDNAQKKVAYAVKKAAGFLRESDVQSAIAILWWRKDIVKGFGMAYASKILRMLSPDKAVVFDSHLETVVGRSLTCEDYADWCEECANAAKILTERGHENEQRRKGRRRGFWKAADVEAVIFSEVRKYNQNVR